MKHNMVILSNRGKAYHYAPYTIYNKSVQEALLILAKYAEVFDWGKDEK